MIASVAVGHGQGVGDRDVAARAARFPVGPAQRCQNGCRPKEGVMASFVDKMLLLFTVMDYDFAVENLDNRRITGRIGKGYMNWTVNFHALVSYLKRLQLE